MGFRFVIDAGPNAGRVYDMPENASWIVGRANDADIALDDHLTSRNHIKIVSRGSTCRLVDLNSRNGTFINDNRIQEVVLMNGDRIKVGHTFLLFSTLHDLDPSASGEVELLFCSKCHRACDSDSVDSPHVVANTHMCANCQANRELDPHVIPGFIIKENLGAGALGAVYRASNKALQRSVVLKILTPAHVVSRAILKRFLREARIGGRLYHSNIIEMFDAATTDSGYYYLSFEYVDGETLFKAIEREGKLSPDKVRMIGAGIGAALQHAHGRGFVHRNIKPENIIISKNGVAKLGDFGLARALPTEFDTQITKPGERLGTLFYMAPEQLRDASAAGPPADVFSLGCCLFHALAGEAPFQGENVPAILNAILTGERKSLATLCPDVPLDLIDAIEKCLFPDLKKRYTDIAGFLGDIGVPPSALE